MLDENLAFVQGRTYFSARAPPVFRRALTIFLCEVHIAVCGCVPYNIKADFDIAIRLFRLGARLLVPIREPLNENGRLQKNSRLESCRGEDEELNIIERHTSLYRVQSCHRGRRPPVTHSGRHDYHERDWTHDIRPESMRELLRTCGHVWRRHRFKVNRSRTSHEFQSYISRSYHPGLPKI
jgi:hypothetical protein